MTSLYEVTNQDSCKAQMSLFLFCCIFLKAIWMLLISPRLMQGNTNPPWQTDDPLNNNLLSLVCAEGLLFLLLLQQRQLLMAHEPDKWNTNINLLHKNYTEKSFYSCLHFFYCITFKSQNRDSKASLRALEQTVLSSVLWVGEYGAKGRSVLSLHSQSKLCALEQCPILIYLLHFTCNS